MINAGAITVTALLHARYGDEAFDTDPRAVQHRGRAAARRSIEAVYESERRTGHRNRAIAHLLLNFGLVHDDAEARARRLFQAVLDSGDLPRPRDDGRDAGEHGQHPLTGAQAYSIRVRQDMLSIMFTCGMYDYSGEWAYRVGRAGEERRRRRRDRRWSTASSASRTYSPPLDKHGNSARGIEVCVELASRLAFTPSTA